MSAPPGDQPAIERISRRPGQNERQRQTAPEQGRAEVCVHRSGNDQHDQVVDHLHQGDRGGVRGEGELQHHADRQSRAQERDHGETVAEHEGQADREDDGLQIAEAGRRAQDHPQDLADGAARQAMQRRGEGEPVQRAAGLCLRRSGMGVMSVRVVLGFGHGGIRPRDGGRRRGSGRRRAPAGFRRAGPGHRPSPSPATRGACPARQGPRPAAAPAGGA